MDNQLSWTFSYDCLGPADESSTLEEFAAVHIADLFANTSLPPGTNTYSESNVTCSRSSPLLPPDSDGLLTSGHSDTSSNFESSRCAYIGSNTDPGRHAFGSVTAPVMYLNHAPDDSALAWHEHSPTINLHNLNQSKSHGALSPPTKNYHNLDGNVINRINEKTSKGHRQHNALESDLNACNFTPYPSFLEELDQIDASILDNGAFSSGESFVSHAHPPHPTEETQPLLPMSHALTTAGVTEEEILPLSPLSDTEQVPTPPLTPATANAIQALETAFDRRRNSHNVVEKRYRTNLNSKIEQLQQCLHNSNIEMNMDASSRDPDAGKGHTTNGDKLQKGLILSNAVAYIKALQSTISQIGARNKFLEDQNKLLERKLAILQRIVVQKAGANAPASNPVRENGRPAPASRLALVVAGVVPQSVGDARRKPTVIVAQEVLEAKAKQFVGEHRTKLLARSSKHDEPCARAKRRKLS